MVPRLDAQKIDARDPVTMERLRQGVEDAGFLTVENTELSEADVRAVIESYRRFFRQPEDRKRAVDMARTGSNRGWGAPGSEQVDPEANPDYKQVFDCGFELAAYDPMRSENLSVYAENQWPADMPAFRTTIQEYYSKASRVSLKLLRGIAAAIGQPEDYFDAAFSRPMALLRGNFYPERPSWATDKDFGIGAHTDYGCLTLLATDGVPGLEAQSRGGAWVPVEAEPGVFIINFGEMLEMWTAGAVRATPHRVKGSVQERISVPMFFNPNHDTNVALIGSGQVIRAGDHLKKRFEETYVHLKAG
ncbi:2-oxoglutarate and iron-dependent oxygenase domain-containing protein [Shimia thalassica]|uniref:isopenicillin N synthase family dioxygenase n=1 Tax=Shimia thalassica TaxID=1715693 RepID=UPI002733F449|nr:2-oxoglutarate and iron-dependent oxygenase domain-containing protein [Shimia thalassica]MDP2495904.1 2-oxoglutarate and iron-dependent oxygenase domain-containing protein [Shimia thalassica]